MTKVRMKFGGNAIPHPDAATQIYGSITYYLLNNERSLTPTLKAGCKAKRKPRIRNSVENPSPGVVRLTKIAAEAKEARLRLRELSE